MVTKRGAAKKMASQETVVDIAIGPNAVENLLDMLVLATLTRQEVESYWVPEYFGEEHGEGLLRAFRDLATRYARRFSI